MCGNPSLLLSNENNRSLSGETVATRFFCLRSNEATKLINWISGL